MFGGGGGGVEVWVIGLVCVWFVFVFIYVFSALVCLFPCLFMCSLFRVSLVFRSTSSVVFFCVYFCVSVYWGFPVLVCLVF